MDSKSNLWIIGMVIVKTNIHKEDTKEIKNLSYRVSITFVQWNYNLYSCNSNFLVVRGL